MRFASELKLEWVHLTGPSIGHRTARFCRSEILRHGVSLLLGSGNAARVFTLTVQGAAGYPYGTDISGQTAQFNPGTIDFATYLNDSSTGLEYANQRWCSAGYVRFVTADKSARSVDVENPQSWNRYWYAAGDPVNVNDPSGNDPTCGPGMVWHGEGCTIGEAGTTAQYCLDYPELCNSGSPPVNQCSAGEEGFDPAPDPEPAPGCILPPPPPIQPKPLNCNVSFSTNLTSWLQVESPELLDWDPSLVPDFIDIGQATDIDPRLFASIGTWESGHGLFFRVNNPFGIGPHDKFKTRFEGLQKLGETLFKHIFRWHQDTVASLYSGKGSRQQEFPAYCVGYGCRAGNAGVSGFMRSQIGAGAYLGTGNPNNLLYPCSF